jgi:hypothetical protein
MPGKAYHLATYAATKRPQEILLAKVIRVAKTDGQEADSGETRSDSLQGGGVVV